jgi:hypothetical protein
MQVYALKPVSSQSSKVSLINAFDGPTFLSISAEAAPVLENLL